MELRINRVRINRSRPVLVFHSFSRIVSSHFLFDVCTLLILFFIAGSDIIMARPASHAYISFYWFLTVTLVATYSGNLIAFMTVTKLKLPIENLRDLASHPEYEAGVSRGSSNHDLFRV